MHTLEWFYRSNCSPSSWQTEKAERVPRLLLPPESALLAGFSEGSGHAINTPWLGIASISICNTYMMLLPSLLLLINSCRIRNFIGNWSFAPTSWLLMDLLGSGLWVGLWKSSPGSDPPHPSSWLALLLFLFLQTVQRAAERAHKTRLPLYPPKKTKKLG